jgi:hypothetical protein
MSLDTKLQSIYAIIEDIKQDDPFVASVLFEGFGIALNTIEAAVKNNGRDKIDISEHLETVSAILGISVRDLVMHVIQSQPGSESNKSPDAETLEFITSDLDDYEKFLAQSKAKDDLDFLSKSI